MTVAAASDFQLRPAIFSERLSLLRLTKYRFGNPTCNLEHRRVKSSLERSGTDESRWLRVERKALVFFPTLNERLSHFQRTIPAILRRGRFAIAREFSHALHSLPRLSVCDFRSRYVNRYASDFLPSADFGAGEEIKKFNSFQQRFRWMENHFPYSFVGQIFGNNHRNVARDSRKFPKFAESCARPQTANREIKR